LHATSQNCLKVVKTKLHATYGFRQFWTVACNCGHETSDIMGVNHLRRVVIWPQPDWERNEGHREFPLWKWKIPIFYNSISTPITAAETVLEKRQTHANGLFPVAAIYIAAKFHSSTSIGGRVIAVCAKIQNGESRHLGFYFCLIFSHTCM